MASKTCMNSLCCSSTSSEWRKGWALRSGEFANLCDKCGSVYEQSIFCEVFHSKDSGWRECNSCGKRLHCGCIASIALLDLLDGGSGVNCTRCSKRAGVCAVKDVEKSNGLDTSKVDNIGNLQSVAADSERKIVSLESSDKGFGTRYLHQFQNVQANGSSRHPKQEDTLPPMEDVGSASQNLDQAFRCSSQTAKPEIYKAAVAAKDIYESLAQTNLSITLGSPIGNLNPVPGTVLDERLQSKASSHLQQGSRSRHLMPKPPKSTLSAGLEANPGLVSQMCVARPPTEGRARNQLLPRYWPRITDQELQQISGDSNSTIVPLFEKVLSASDAGRIGRLVLPKACAEAYFPSISQPEGLPLRIQDVKGKEWVFQFRFWPNNNSRMYVLEGVTPCIQSMKLKAGDTVMFSRMDPEGKLLMGFRKASNSMAVQDAQPSAIPKGPHASESLFSGVFDNPPIISGYSGLINSVKGGRGDSQLHALSKKLHSASGDISWYNSDKHDDRNGDELLLPSLLAPERKRTRNIGSKIKRMLIDSLDALELKLTWEEAQDLLRPPPTIKPSIVTIEDHDFEEYEEPPVFGKRSIFVARSIGGQEQWAQCDTCAKWRRLPLDVLLPSKWTCAENAWDQSRCSCSAPDELTPSELENLLRLSKDFRKRRITSSQRLGQEHEPSGLDALARAVILEDVGDPGTTAVATTTKHPRHRPGCSCIVCIQPPSGKGKHKPTCTCNVCMTVKRRFKTLMMRKKKRQSEREAEIARENQCTVDPKDEAEVDSSSKPVPMHLEPSDNEARSVNDLESKGQSNDLSIQFVDNGKGHLDLNCQPDRDEEAQAGSDHPSMMTLLQVASLPLDTYLKQNGLTSLASEQQAGSASQVPSQTGESEGQPYEECQPDSAVQTQESGGDGSCEPGPDQSQKDQV